jgi:hypothetical protein
MAEIGKILFYVFYSSINLGKNTQGVYLYLCLVQTETPLGHVQLFSLNP